MVSSMWLGAPRSKSQNEWTGVERRALYPVETQGRQGRMPQLKHPSPTLPVDIFVSFRLEGHRFQGEDGGTEELSDSVFHVIC